MPRTVNGTGHVPLFVTHVTESHARNAFGVPEDFRPDTWRETARTLERQWKLPAGAIAYVQETAAISLQDWRIVRDYASVFGLSEASTAAREVVEYVRFYRARQIREVQSSAALCDLY